MQQQSNAAIDRTLGIDDAVPYPCSPWSVAALEILPAFRLKVRFHDGSSGIVNMSALIHSPEAGVFASLSDESLFGQAYIDCCGAVAWPGGCPDLAPDAMHRAIATSGEWTP